MLRRNTQATTIGDSDAPTETCLVTEKIGLMLAKHGITVVTGGRGGVMEASCRGARNTGGITIGILPAEKASDVWRVTCEYLVTCHSARNTYF